MNNKAMYGIGYASQSFTIKAKRLSNLIRSSSVITKQKKYITEGSYAAQVAFLSNRIMECTEGDIGYLKESLEEIKNKYTYLNFSEKVFREAKRKVIEEYSTTEEVLINNHAPQLG